MGLEIQLVMITKTRPNDGFSLVKKILCMYNDMINAHVYRYVLFSITF